MILKPIEEFTWYHHDMENKKTYVFMFNGSREDLVGLLRSRGPHQGTIDIAEGFARCHPNDQYEKAVGRTVSQFNATMSEAVISNAYFDKYEEHYTLRTNNKKTIYATYYKDSGKLILRATNELSYSQKEN